jgi:hypothetical protein
MNPEVKKRWLEALRSGEYAQTTGKLHRFAADVFEPSEIPPGYCCLGVLCDLAAKDGLIETRTSKTWSDVEEFGIFEADEDYSTATLPVVVQMWAGLDSGNPNVLVTKTAAPDVLERMNNKYPGTDTFSLAEINDTGASFQEVANIIEEQL